MARKLPDLPPEIAQAFLADMRAFFEAGGTGVKADGIAARQIEPLNAHLGPRERRLKIPDIKAMFIEMRDYLDEK